MENIMQTALYVIWALVPIGFFTMALWSKLEQVSHKDKMPTREAADLSKQGIFTLVCVLAAFIIDIYFVADIEPLLPTFIPLGFVKIMLLPVILYLGGMALGGSNPIRITKVHVHEQTRQKGPSQSSGKKKKKRKK